MQELTEEKINFTTKPQRTRSLKRKGSLEICSLCLWVFGGLCSFCELPFDCTRPLHSNLRVLCVFVVKLIFSSVNSCISVAKIPRAFGTRRQIHIQNSSFIAPEASIKGILAWRKRARTPGTSGSERELRLNANRSRSFPALSPSPLVAPTANPPPITNSPKF